jgi:hypothetical protein
MGDTTYRKPARCVALSFFASVDPIYIIEKLLNPVRARQEVQ